MVSLEGWGRGRGEGFDERDEGARAESRVFTQQSSYLDKGWIT